MKKNVMKAVVGVAVVLGIVAVGALFSVQLSKVDAQILLPHTETLSAQNVGATGATLRGNVDIKGLNKIDVWFDYDTNSNFSNAKRVGFTTIYNNAQPYTYTVTNLNSNTRYYYRIGVDRADKQNGTVYGAVMQFTTTSGGSTGGTGSCANGHTLSVDEARAAFNGHQLKIYLTVNAGNRTAQARIENGTNCDVPMSLASYKVFDRVLSHQVLYDRTSEIFVPKKNHRTITVNLPSCMAQSDVYYGAAPSQISDDPNHISNRAAFTSAWYLNNGTNHQNASGQFCTNTPPPPPPSTNLNASCTASASVVNTNTSVTFTAQASGASSYTYSWDGDEGVAGNGQTITKTFTTPGTKSVRVRVSSGNSSATAQCTVTVQAPQQPATLNGSCYATPSTANVNDTVTWVANATGGSGSYTYSWSGWDNLSGTSQTVSKSYNYAGTKTATVAITSGGQTIYRDCSMVVQQPSTSNLDGYCYATPSSVLSGNTVTWIANASGGAGNYSYSWSGDVSGSGQSVSRSYSGTGSRTATVTIYSGGQSITRNCHVNVYQNSVYSLNLYCVVNPTNAHTGDTVTYSVNASGGDGYYNYSWSGDEGIYGSGQSVSKTYYTSGQKYAYVSVSSRGVTTSTTCSTYISPRTHVPPPPPYYPPQQPGGVYLSQVPYTGIDSVGKVALFVGGLFVWSAAVAYFLIRRKAKKDGVTVAGLFRSMNPQAAYVTGAEHIASTVASVDTSVVETLEQAARTEQVLVSKQGLEMLVDAARGDSQTAETLLYQVMNHMGTKAGEWTTLSTEKVAQALSEIQK